ncbi:MAG: hypothetical protein AAF921_23620 [Cyanobacteria bacterium P01_D01_bin.44]
MSPEEKPRTILGTFAPQGDQSLDKKRAIKLTLPVKERDEVEALAQEEGLSVTEMARELVIEALRARTKEKETKQ